MISIINSRSCLQGCIITIHVHMLYCSVVLHEYHYHTMCNSVCCSEQLGGYYCGSYIVSSAAGQETKQVFVALCVINQFSWSDAVYCKMAIHFCIIITNTKLIYTLQKYFQVLKPPAVTVLTRPQNSSTTCTCVAVYIVLVIVIKNIKSMQQGLKPFTTMFAMCPS